MAEFRTVRRLTLPFSRSYSNTPAKSQTQRRASDERKWTGDHSVCKLLLFGCNAPHLTVQNSFTEIGLEPVAQPVFKPPASLSGANTTAISILEEEPHPDDLDGTLEHIYQPIRGLQAGTLIIRERLDNKRSLFMDRGCLHPTALSLSLISSQHQ